MTEVAQHPLIATVAVLLLAILAVVGVVAEIGWLGIGAGLAAGIGGIRLGLLTAGTDEARRTSE